MTDLPSEEPELESSNATAVAAAELAALREAVSRVEARLGDRAAGSNAFVRERVLAACVEAAPGALVPVFATRFAQLSDLAALHGLISSRRASATTLRERYIDATSGRRLFRADADELTRWRPAVLSDLRDALKTLERADERLERAVEAYVAAYEVEPLLPSGQTLRPLLASFSAQRTKVAADVAAVDR
eukprot:gnl/Ergobibamus_cyprinoides/3781.p1 GENE.gnl/Ergobibamus_cyprinoides/3781~~gnl/Ergobibamus_cyprinoides/3781.p1  ORF type:complete len:189 (+),score=33.07 gnl/Ergobibamus_cyprinoides/3781:185-751(+)